MSALPDWSKLPSAVSICVSMLFTHTVVYFCLKLSYPMIEWPDTGMPIMLPDQCCCSQRPSNSQLNSAVPGLFSGVGPMPYITNSVSHLPTSRASLSCCGPTLHVSIHFFMPSCMAAMASAFGASPPGAAASCVKAVHVSHTAAPASAVVNVQRLRFISCLLDL